MSFRENLNRRPAIVAGAAILAIAVVAFVIVRQVRSLSSGGREESAFYTVDDGKSWFVDDASKVPPFDKNGKAAVLAFVYRCKESGEPFVGYMQRFSEEAKNKLPALLAEAKGSKEGFQRNMGAIQSLMGSVEYKKPGDAKWQKETIAVVCPNGRTQDLQRVVAGQ